MLEVIVMENDMEQDLTILTERQRQVYLLRAQKLTFAAIGTQLGVSAAAAGSAYRAAGNTACGRKIAVGCVSAQPQRAGGGRQRPAAFAARHAPQGGYRHAAAGPASAKGRTRR